MIIKVPHEMPITYSFAEIPREVPVELKSYFPCGLATCTVIVVEFDGNTYHLLDEYENVLTRPAIDVVTRPAIDVVTRQAIDVVTGDIVTLQFEMR